MSHFAPITNANQLPNIGEVAEKSTMDFKVTVDPGDQRELAKDVAAFANHLGGTLVIGGVEQNEKVTHYKCGKNQREIGEIRRAFEHAVRDRCLPPPLVEFSEVTKDGAQLLLVNIHPVPDTLVAVTYENKGKNGLNACFFPLRTSTQTTTISPDLLPMYLSPKIRKNVIMLNRIGRGNPVEFMNGVSVTHYVFVEIREVENALLLKRGETVTRHSLDLIDTVYRHKDDSWRIHYSL